VTEEAMQRLVAILRTAAVADGVYPHLGKALGDTRALAILALVTASPPPTSAAAAATGTGSAQMGQK
jgi:hypothetical protein